MNVTATQSGLNYLKGKHEYVESYLDRYVEVLGEKNISDLTALLKVTANSEAELVSRFGSSAGIK